jgi:hypothetical protein
MRNMRIKFLPIVLPPTLYRALEREARKQDRDPLQQARWILKQHLEALQDQPYGRPDAGAEGS